MSDMSGNRKEFLMKIYDQMYNDINRHILVTWQSFGVVVGAFAVFALVEKEVIEMSIASSIVVALCGWLIAHLLDSGYWYNRNLVIIANIERLFLLQSDLKNVHYYFGAHRPNNKMIRHLKIQVVFGVSLAGLSLAAQILSEHSLLSEGLPKVALFLMPFVVAIIAFIFILCLSKRIDESYTEFLQNSPGTDVDITGIKYGVGHGH